MPVASGAAVSVPSNQKCCNNQLVPASSSSCGSMCGGAATDGTVVCTSQTSFVTCSNLSPIVQALNCPQGTVCCAAANGVSACRYSWECTTQYTPPATTTTTYVPPPPPAPTYSGTYAQCSGKADGTLVCTSGNTLNYCLNGGLASAADQYCPAGLVCCPNLGRCDVAGCPQYAVAPPSASCAGVPDNNIVCKSATTFNICQNGAEVNSAPQSCQAGLVCCQGLNRCDVAGCASTATSPPVYTPGIPAVPTGSCTNKPDNYVVCTSATTFNICKSGAKPYADQTCQAGLICCEGAQRCDATCAAPYVPPPTTPAPSTPPTTYGSSCTGKPDGYVVCQSKTTLNYCLSGALVKAVDQSCPPGLECCQAQQACGYPGCSYTPPPKTCAGLKDNQIVCKSLTTFNICFNGVEASAVDQSCPATTVCCGNLNRCDVAGCAGTPSVVPPVSPPPPPPYNPNPNPAGCTGKKDNQIICRSTTTFNICHDGVFSGQDQKCPNKLVCCDNLNRCDYAGCVGTPSPIPQDGSSGSYTKTPQVKNSGGSCVGKADGYVTCTAPNTFNICAGGVKSGVWDQYCPAGLTCCEKTQSCESSCPSYVPPTPPAINCDGLADSTFVCTGGNTFTLCQGGLATPSQTCPSGLVCCSGKGKCDYPGCATTPYVPPTPSTPAYVPPVINCKGVPDGKIACASATSFRICQNGLPASSVDINCQPGLYCCANTNKCDVAGCPGAGYVAPAPVPYDPSVCQNVKDGNIYCTSANTFNMCQNGLPVSSSSQTCPPGLVCCAASNRCDVPGCPVSYGSVVAPTYSGGSTFKYAPIVVGLSVKSPSSITTCDCSGQPDNRLRCTSPTTFNFCYGQTPVTAYDQSCPAGLTCCEATQRCEASCSSAPPQYAPSPPVYTPSSGSLCSGISNNGVVCTGPTTFNICWNQTYASAVDQSCPSGQTCCSNTGRCDSADCPTSVTYAPPPYGPPHTCSGKKDNQIICTGSNTFKYCVNQQIYSSNDITCPAGLVCCEGTNRCDVAGCPGSAPTYTPPPTPAYIPPPVYAPSCSGAKDGSIICRSKTTFNYCKSGSVLNAADQSCPYGTVCCAQSNLCDYPGNCASVLPPSTIPTLPAPSCSSISDGGIACISLYQFRYCSKGAFVSSAPQTCAKGTVCCADSNRCDYLSNCKSVLPVAPPVDVPTYTTSSNICAGLPDNHVACVNTKSFSLCLNQVPSTGNQNCAAGTVCCGNACVYPDDPKCGGVPQNPCLSIPDGGMACSDTAKYVLCQNSSPITPSMPCAPGTVCCGNACVFSSDPMCATTPGPVCAPTQALPPPVYNPPPVVVPTNVGSCVGAADNNIVCTSSTTFNFCLNQKILPLTADQYCPTGTYCCQALQRCLRVGECPVNPNTPALPDKCTGLPDNAQLCVSATQFNLCWKGRELCQY
ncbi:hypothetical protein DFJ73DRAFT_482770 [Zopfochytrium polystomum]|nr:hypothetical protein DFJ73DRAFT_482770 [Zopfochytrium polystomum]